jgi:peptide chain release factor 1
MPDHDAKNSAKAEYLNSAKTEYDKLIELLGDPELISDWEKFEELSKKKAFLEKILEKGRELQEIDRSIHENLSIISTEEEPELTSLAQAEAEQLKIRKITLEKELDEIIAGEKKPKGPKAVVVEVRAGTGGEEAALFAADLFRMYSRFAQNMEWHQKILDSSQTEIGGIKEIIFELRGSEVWNYLKYEAGVHRIQRIPITEKSGRIHTSTATVAVLPKPDAAEFKIRNEDIKVDFFCSSGPGGQYVNKRESAVRLTHIPTGLVVASQTERNQLSNRENAMAILVYRIQELKRKEEEEKFGGERKTQIGGAKRSEKIRTYNIPQDRITDHRIKKSWYNIDDVMNGGLKHISEEMIKDLPEE